MATKKQTIAEAKIGFGKPPKKPPTPRTLTEAEMDKNRDHYCVCCGKKYPRQQGNFMRSYSMLWAGNGGYLTTCKTCVEKYFKELKKFYDGDEEKALERMCQIFDWFYSYELSQQSIGVKDSRIESYLSIISITKNLNRGRDYLQTIRNVSNNGPMITSLDGLRDTQDDGDVDLNGDDDDVYEFEVTKEIAKRWGKGMHAEEYEYLEEQYADWCDKTKVESKSQEELIKAICLAQFNVREAQRRGGKVAEAMKALTDLMTNCNLTPRQASESANMDAMQISFGQLIKQIEDEEPIPEPEEEFKDPDGIRKYLTTYFYGHLAKALHIKNDFQKEYEEEISKYTVLPPDGGDQSAFEEIFGDNANATE